LAEPRQSYACLVLRRSVEKCVEQMSENALSLVQQSQAANKDAQNTAFTEPAVYARLFIHFLHISLELLSVDK
jgi:hypothetical protein